MELKGVKVTARGQILLAAAAFAVVMVLFCGIRWMTADKGDDGKTLVSATVACDVMGISPRTTGQITRVAVKEGALVKKGDILFTIDKKEASSKLKHAGAVLEIAKTELAKAAGGARIQEIAAAQTLVFQASADLDSRVAERDSTRDILKTLNKTYEMLLRQLAEFKNPQSGAYEEDYAAKLVSVSYSKGRINDTQYAVKAQLIQQQFSFKAQLETQRAALQGRVKSLNAAVEASKSAVESAESRLDLVAEGASSKDMEILVKKVKAAQIAFDAAKDNLESTTVRAPLDGTVTRLGTKEGEMAVPGNAVVYLADMNKLYIYALADQKKLDSLKLGQPVHLFIKGAGTKEFTGKISEIGTATLEFSGIQPASLGKRSVDKNRIPVKIEFDRKGMALIPGMDVDIDL